MNHTSPNPNPLLCKGPLPWNQHEFQQPPAFMWPAYDWVINDAVDTNTLLAQLRDMREHDARSVALWFLPRDLYSYVMGSRTEIAYASPQFWQLLTKILEQCQQLGMNYLIHEEPGWPCGMAGGLVLKRDPDRFSLKLLQSSALSIPSGSNHTLADDVIFATVQLDNQCHIFRPPQTAGPFPHDAQLHEFRISQQTTGPIYKDNPYVNLLNPDVTQTYINLAHEAYKEHLAEHFTRTACWFYADEPTYGGVGYDPVKQFRWTEGLEHIFLAEKGYRLEPFLSRLMQPPQPAEPAELTNARIDYHELLAELFARNFLAPVHKWCTANHMASGGHLLMDHDPARFPEGGHGHLLRSFRQFDIPGVDTIYRESYPGVRSHHFPKYASSVARQADCPFVSSQPLPVSGAGTTPALYKWTIDHQYVRGVTLMHNPKYPCSTRDHLMAVSPRPLFGPVNPLWKYMDLAHRYVARLGYVLSRGHAPCSTAIYFDMRSIWAGATYKDHAVDLHDALADALLKTQRDFDYIDDDILAGKLGRTENGKLIVGPMQYDTIIVAATNWMQTKAFRGLLNFAQQGGRIITVGGFPAHNPAHKDNCRTALQAANALSLPTPDALPPLIEPLVTLNPPCPDIRLAKRATEEHRIYFLCNELDREISTTIIFPENTLPVRCDLPTAELYRVNASQNSDGVAVDAVFAPFESFVFLFGPTATAQDPHIISKEDRLPLDKPWTIRPSRQIIAGEHDFEYIEPEQTAFVPIELGDWRSTLGEYFSGDGEYLLHFDCPAPWANRPAALDLGIVKYACEVFLNGQSLGRRAWAPFALPCTEQLKPGPNELRIIVTNTLSNAIAEPQYTNSLKKYESPDGPTINMTYDQICRAFEKDSLASGLFGPVTLRPLHPDRIP